MSAQLLPRKVEDRLRELAFEVRQRQRIQGLTRFGLSSAALTAGLGTLFYLLEGTSVPLLLPLAAYLFGLAAAWQAWVRRAAGPVARERLALYLDEQFPEFENAFVSGATLGGRSTGVPDWMIERFHERLREATATVTLPHILSGPAYRRVGVNGLLSLFVGLAVFGFVLSLWDADRLANGLLHGLRSARLPFTVEPGHVRLARGADQTIWLHTGDKEAVKAIRWREAGGPWQTDPLSPGRGGNVYYHPFRNLQADVDYEVRIGATRTETFTLTVWTPPEVSRVDLLVHYPDYLGLEPRPVAYDGTVTIPEGSALEIDVAVNKALASASIRLANAATSQSLAPGDARIWSARLDVAGPDTLSILLRDLDGEAVEDPRRYVIRTTVDAPPEIQVRTPRGDDEATSLEEIPFAFSVRDDYGLRDYGIRYEISGSDPVTLSLRDPSATVEADVHHLLPLETLGLRAGDLLVWSIWAEDRKPGRDSLEFVGDPYFLEIRPFLRQYTRAVSDGGTAQQQGGQDGDPAARQKQVIIATWNLRKEASRIGNEAFDARRAQISGAQLDVLQAADTPAPGPRARRLAEELREAGNAALAALQEAAWTDPSAALNEALGHEQRAYRALLMLKPEETQITRLNGNRGPGSGGRSQREVDALEVDARRDFREEASTFDEQLARSEQVHDAIEDLARRQQAINEDIAGLISELESGPVRDEGSRRRLEQLRQEQRNNLAELDRLQGEIASRGLDPEQTRDARQQLETARGEMSRGSGHLEQEDLQRARAAGSRALGGLAEVGRRMRQLSREAAAGGMRDLQQKLEALREEQQAILEETRAHDGEGQPKSLEAGPDAGEALVDRKKELAESFSEFMNEAGELAERAHEGQELVSRRLGDWLRETSQEGIYEDIQKGESYIRYGAWDVAEHLEEAIRTRLDSAGARLDGVAADLVEDDLSATRRAADELDRLVAQADSAGFGPGFSTSDPTPPAPGSRLPSGEGGTWAAPDWDAAMRTAEALLPEGGEARRRISGAREEMLALDRRYRRSNLLPPRDIVIDAVFGPLAEVAGDLRREVDRRSAGRRLTTPDSRGVPERYRDAVAEYFRRLSELER